MESSREQKHRLPCTSAVSQTRDRRSILHTATPTVIHHYHIVITAPMHLVCNHNHAQHLDRGPSSDGTPLLYYFALGLQIRAPCRTLRTMCSLAHNAAFSDNKHANHPAAGHPISAWRAAGPCINHALGQTRGVSAFPWRFALCTHILLVLECGSAFEAIINLTSEGKSNNCV